MSSFGDYALHVEELAETEICALLNRTRYPPRAPAPKPPRLAAGGVLDDCLLELGNSWKLLAKLVETFQNEPANDSGRQPHSAGTFHGFHGGAYTRSVFSADAVCKLLALGPKLWGSKPNVTKLTVSKRSRLVIVGDTHGQLEDVLWIFFKYGVPSSENVYLFDGDLVDRGGHALEILLLLIALKRDNEHCVHIIRGNHEDESTCTAFGFKAELESKFVTPGVAGWIFHFCNHELFPVLPLAAVVSDETDHFRMCVLHGGVPVRCPGVTGSVLIDSHIEGLNRRFISVQKDITTYTSEDHIIFNMMWADPAKGDGLDMIVRGRGNAFTEKDTADFCRANRVHCVVRAHQPPGDGRGFLYLHGNRCITIFSASNYCGNLGNRGGVLICDLDSMSRRGPQPAEHMTPSWPALAQVIRAHGFNARKANRMQAAVAVERAGGVVTEAALTAGLFKKSGSGTSLASPTTPRSRMSPKGTSTGSSMSGVPKASVETISSASSPSRATATASPRAAVSPALQQVENYVVEMVARHKQRLFVAFTKHDPQTAGSVPFQTWQSVMTTVLPDVPPVWKDLAQIWTLPELVPYVHFLHRFQIISEISASRMSTHVDLFDAMAQLRFVISDVSSTDLMRGLDGDLNGAVSLQEFQTFLEAWGVQVPQWQTAALYEVLLLSLKNRPNVDDVLLGIAMVSKSPAVLTKGQEYADLAREIGEQITKSGRQTLVGLFRAWDVDKNGFLSPQEVKTALEKTFPSMGRTWSDTQMQALVQHMDGQGVENNRVSLIEFLRALGPRTLARDLSCALLGEVLKPIYYYRSVLETYFVRFDPGASNVVTTAQFVEGLQEMNRQLVSEGAAQLTKNQVHAIAEIASQNTGRVQYRDFLKSLRVIDTSAKRA